MIARVTLLAAAAAVAPPPVTVPTVLRHADAWTGRQVVVRGWAHGCAAPVANLQGRCYLTPAAAWRHGRDRLLLEDFPRQGGGAETIGHVTVRGAVQPDACPADAICLDGERAFRVTAVEQAGKRPA